MGEGLTNYSLAETMQYIEKVINQNPEPISSVNLLYQFDISGEEEGSYHLQLQAGQAKVAEESDIPADCTLNMSFKNFRLFLTGSLSGTVAFMTGKIKIKGDITKSMKLEMLVNYPPLRF